MKFKPLFLTLLVLSYLSPLFANNTDNNIIWYQQPAGKWMEAIPTGNGRLSAMIYGGIARERLALNEISMWAGQPDSTSNDLCGKEHLNEMRKCFFENNPQKGNELGEKYLTGRMTTFGTHVPLGDFVIDFTYQDNNISNYHRELDMNNATTTITFKAGDVTYKREYIADYPDDVIAMRFTASKKESINACLSLELLQKAVVSADNNGITLNGKVEFAMHGKGGVQFCGNMRIIPDGGHISHNTNSVSVNNANSLVILIDIRTNYNNVSYKNTCNATITKAAEKGYDTLKHNHIADYSTLFNRMSISLGDNANNKLATDTRLKLVQNGAVDPNFDALFLQYARYMLISSSRKSSMPLCANLQGVWNDNMACNMPWTCDYHLDINIQQNYWSANRTNLAECNEPLFDYLGLLAKNGAITADKIYGCKGWVAHTVCNVWGYTAPGWGIYWGMNVTGGAWLATHLWSHYQYTHDREYLRNIGYPLLKKSAEFFMDYMVIDPRSGHLVTGPSISPENGYISYNGNNLGLDMMPTIDRNVVYDIYTACIESSKILGIDKSLRKRLEKDIKLLPPLTIGSDGQIQEWNEDVRRSDPSHRHSSHMHALFPLNQISYTQNPELIEAANKGLRIQTSNKNWEDTEWSTANMLCFTARLKQPQVAHGWLQNLLKRFTRENLMTVSPKGVAGANNDIFSFDATEASAAGMCEMLLQSYDGFIEFLPALPKEWKDGSVTGLVAEGGLVIDMTWHNSTMQEASITAKDDCSFRIKGVAEKISLKKNETKKIIF